MVGNKYDAYKEKVDADLTGMIRVIGYEGFLEALTYQLDLEDLPIIQRLMEEG